MKLTKEKQEEFIALTKPVIKWLNENCHPHVVVTIEPDHAEINEGVMSYPCHDYFQD